jgi:hypothetical protein
MALLRGQRAPLLAVTAAYRTVSGEGLPVIAGVLPADLEVLEYVAIRSLRTDGRAEHLGMTVVAETGIGGLSRAIRRVRERTLVEWQRRWDGARSGRLTYRFLPCVTERMKRAYLRFDHYSVQLITGHGQLRGKLFQLGLRDDPMCSCGMGDQTAEHILWECPILEDARDEMLSGMIVSVPQPIWFGNICESETNFRCSDQRFVAEWVRRWELLERPGIPRLG